MQDQNPDPSQNQAAVQSNQPQPITPQTPIPTALNASVSDVAQSTQNPNAGMVVYASFLKRFAALLIDAIILSFVSFVIQLPLSFTQALLTSNTIQGSNSDASAGMLVMLFSFIGYSIAFLINIAYYVGFLVKKGATPGKMALGLVVVDTNLGKLTFSKALLRETVGKFASAIALGIGYLWVIWDEKKQGWHDKIANTLVVEKKSLG